MRFSKSTISKSGLMSLFFGLIFTLGSASVSNAATITVNSIADTAATNGKCTLREAISNAQTNSDTTGGDCTAGAGDDTIRFSISGTILLGSTLPTITIEGGALTIDGTGRSVILDGQNAVRVMVVAGSVTLSNLTIANGNSGGSEGGGVRNLNGTLAVNDCTFSGNNGSSGGGIHSTGTLTVAGSTFSGNTASYGAGVQISFSSLAITNSSFTGNSASQWGGGVINDNSSTTITGSTFSNNTAGASGGAVYGGNSPVNISDSILSGNHAPRGGGIWAGFVVNVVNSTLSGNTADLGGAIYSNEGTPFVSVRNSTLSGNSATTIGGALYLPLGLNAVSNSTFSNNSAPIGGGLYGVGPGVADFSVKNSTFLNSGIVNSFAADGFPLPMYNTIVAGGSTCSGVTDGGYNIDTGATCGFSGTSQSNFAGPLLDPQGLRDNGGETHTIALLAGSTAVNAVPVGTNGCGAADQTDQRGVTRPQGAGCDIGAFEAILDTDGDGVLDNADLCPGTVLPEARPPHLQRFRYYAIANGRFVDKNGTWSGITVANTKGCSGPQIVQATGAGDQHLRFGISGLLLIYWIVANQ